MIFPIAVQFKQPLHIRVSDAYRGVVLQYIKEFIQDRSAKNIVVENDTVTYRGSTSPWRGSLFGGLAGTFNFMEEEGRCFLVYQLRMVQLFAVTSILSVAAGLLSHDWRFALGAFLWLCGANWVVYLARHRSLLTDIASGIDTVYFLDK